MPRINILDELTINKIAAGEVVERPASAVKELLDNAIDAGAKKILIEVREAGKSFILVSDDGCGMDSLDARNCILRHATSKISEAKDLFAITTLGFRGEALSSICAVSHMEIRTSDSNEGSKLIYEGGKLVKKESYVMPRGTTIIVKDLFFNTPARKKHLKSMETELSHITSLVTRYALCYPGIHIELVHNGKHVILAPAADFLGRVSGLLGIETSKGLLSLEYQGKLIRLTGAISKRGTQYPHKNNQFLFINKRPVQNKMITDSAYEAYHTQLNVGKHPAFILHLNVNPTIVDVNVHPQKQAVRFDKEDLIGEEVKTAIKAVLDNDRLPEMPRKPISEAVIRLDSFAIKNEAQKSIDDKPQRHVEPPRTHKVIGQVLDTYVFVASKDEVIMIDQHAAAERVNYERFMEQYSAGTVKKQELIEPVLIDLSPAERLTADHHASFLANIGFVSESFGKNSIRITSVPVIFGRLEGRDAFLSIIDELKDKKSTVLDKAMEERIIRMACKKSVKANQRLEHAEIVKLVDELMKAKSPFTCPHGRPTMVKLTQADFEKMFRRRI